MKTLSLLLFILSLKQAHAFNDKWTKAYQGSLNDYLYATFWGGIRRGFYWNENRGAMTDIHPEHFKEKLPVYIQSDAKQKDLWIFYPGVFGKPDGRISPSVIDVLEERDVHVAVIPNIIAPTYLTTRPIPSKDLEAEKINQEDILKAVIQKIDPTRIRNLHIVAESLGAFQALTALSDSDINYHSLTLLWPPLYLDRSLIRFDYLIKNERTRLDKCSLWWKWPKYIYQTKWQETPDLSPEDKSCLGSWIIGKGFVNSIKDTAKIYLKDKSKDNPIPETFSGFMKTVLPELAPLIDGHDERLSVPYLLKHLKYKNNLRMFSSLDDFLNEPEEWGELKKQFPEIKEIHLFPWGGHSGPLGIKELLPEIINPRDYSRSEK